MNEVDLEKKKYLGLGKKLAGREARKRKENMLEFWTSSS